MAETLAPAVTSEAGSIAALLNRDRRWRTEENLPATISEPPAIVTSAAKLTIASALRRSIPFATSFITSVVVHLAALLAAALIVVASSGGKMPNLEVFGSLLEAHTIDEATLELPVAVISGNASSAMESSVASFHAELDPGVMHGSATHIEMLNLGPSASAIGDGDKAGLSENAGEGKSLEGDGAGGSGGNPKGDSGAEFFGVQASGKKFVFVCDCSRSMTGMKWMELNRELARSIEALAPEGSAKTEKSFYIVFFDGEMHPMFAPSFRQDSLLLATPENIEKARLWLSGISLGANTSPYESMKLAADFEPDAIFLLTDGEFSDYTAPYMREFNKKRKANGKKMVAVHTIGFFSQKHQMVLERIAKDSGGMYKFIAEPHVPKPKRRSWNVVAPPPGSMPAFNAGPGIQIAPRGNGRG